MKIIKRALDIPNPERSYFLFGPRQTGKTTYLKENFPNSRIYNLNFNDDFFRFQSQPSEFRNEVLAMDKKNWIIVDEVQRLPVLLNEVHALIDNGYKFILTGSSARSLKKKGVNLLAGRARQLRMFPFLYTELRDEFNLNEALQFGLLPYIYFSHEKEIELQNYINLYLKEEIISESVVRKIQGYTNFLNLAAQTNGQVLNFTKISSDVGVSSTTVKEYYQILEDTFMGHILEPLKKNKSRKPVSTSKFYFFDIGVSNFLAKRKSILPNTPYFGDSFEHFIHNEIRAAMEYLQPTGALNFWRTHDNLEVDFIINENVAVEVKGGTKIKPQQLKPLNILDEEISLKSKIIVYTEKYRQQFADILALPYRDFLTQLWAGKFF